VNAAVPLVFEFSGQFEKSLPQTRHQSDTDPATHPSRRGCLLAKTSTTASISGMLDIEERRG
jgi:hypothetical protein